MVGWMPGSRQQAGFKGQPRLVSFAVFDIVVKVPKVEDLMNDNTTQQLPKERQSKRAWGAARDGD